MYQKKKKKLVVTVPRKHQKLKGNIELVTARFRRLNLTLCLTCKKNQARFFCVVFFYGF